MSASTQRIPQSFAEVEPNILKTQGSNSDSLAEVHRFHGPAADPLRWLESHSPCRLELQAIRPGAREKNRVLLTWSPRGGEVRTVGARSIVGAIFRASIRERVQAAQAAKGVQV